MSTALFLREYVRNWQSVGAVAPSSPHLARRMMEYAEVWRAEHVLELGPGTGVFTRSVADVMPAGGSYLGIDLNPSFLDTLRPQFPKFRFEQAAAQEFDFAPYLKDRKPFDALISGLPWTAFPRSLQEAILDHVLPNLASGARFATFAYWGFHRLPSGRRFRELLHDRLPGVETSRVVWANLPPAFVYVGRKA